MKSYIKNSHEIMTRIITELNEEWKFLYIHTKDKDNNTIHKENINSNFGFDLNTNRIYITVPTKYFSNNISIINGSLISVLGYAFDIDNCLEITNDDYSINDDNELIISSDEYIDIIGDNVYLYL